MPAENIVEVHHLKKSVGQGEHELSILTGVELVVKRGETIALVGESGSGKSTLLAILAGLDDGSSGEVSLVGQPLHNMDEEARAKWEYQQRICAGSCVLTLIQAPTAKQSKLLARLEEICRRLGRSPLRDELSPSLRNELSENFGSLRNALFQLGRAPLAGSEAQRLRIKLRKSGSNKESPT